MCPPSCRRVADMFQSVQLNVNNPHFLIMQGRVTKVGDLDACLTACLGGMLKIPTFALQASAYFRPCT